jgi:hypothetical protein
MRENRLNISILIFIHLFIFITPLSVKAFHRHNEHFSAVSGGLIYVEHEKPCSICQYEFVTFIADKTPEYTVCLPVFQSGNIQSEAQIFNLPFIHFSHRAPPVA